MARLRVGLVVAAPLAAVVLLAGCGTTPTNGLPRTALAATAPKDIGPEGNPVGGIPVVQVYVPYAPPAQIFTVSVPEGWARINDGAAVVLTDGLAAVRIEEQPALVAVTPETVRREELPAVQAAATGYRFGSLTVVQRRSGPVILATYQTTSPADPVTNKVGLNSVERYVFWHPGFEVILTLSSPVGTDDVGPWQIITDSLQWT